jgi:hypothetical protein
MSPAGHCDAAAGGVGVVDEGRAAEVDHAVVVGTQQHHVASDSRIYPWHQTVLAPPVVHSGRLEPSHAHHGGRRLTITIHRCPSRRANGQGLYG